MKQLLFLFAILSTGWVLQAQDQKPVHSFNVEDGLAVQGYDVVAYFTASKAVKGTAVHTVQYQGISYRFSSAANKELFRKNPSAYAPQYGGWCAYAMGATGEKVEIDPATFKIVSGKLYLFYNKFFNNTRTTWNKEEVVLKAKADANWAKIFH